MHTYIFPLKIQKVILMILPINSVQMTVDTMRYYHHCCKSQIRLKFQQAPAHPPMPPPPNNLPQATLLSLNQGILPFSTWDGLARIRTWIICMVRQRLPMSTRPAAGADPFLTIKILKCQAFSENPVGRKTGFTRY